MKEFFKRVGLFAGINAVLIGLFMLITNLSADMCILYPTLASCFIGIPHEFFKADKEERKPDIAGGIGAAWFGSIGIAAVIFAICLIAGVIV